MPAKMNPKSPQLKSGFWKNGMRTSVTEIMKTTMGIPMNTLKGRSSSGCRILITITPKKEAEYRIHCA